MPQLIDYQHEATMAEIILQRDVAIIQLLGEKESLTQAVKELERKVKELTPKTESPTA